jgi:PAS domain S-box-containing protein
MSVGSASAEQQVAPFVERIRAQGRRRFIWSVDREGRFVSVSQPLSEVVGPENAIVAGLTWAEITERWVIDEGDRIGDCFARRATWSDETVLWRIADTSYAVPVDLGGMPVFGRGHAFEGFRGFGLCRADEIRPAPDSPLLRTRVEAADDAPAASGPAATADPVVEPDEEASPSSEEGEDADLAFEQVQARIGAQLGGARAFPLRALPEAEAQSRASKPSDPQIEGKPILSVAERGALREIARALGARLESDDAQDQTRSRGPAEIVSISAARPREPDAIRILERLPVGVLVLRGDAPLFANRCALDLLGYAKVEELKESTRLFAGRIDSGEGSLALVARTGARLPVEARLTSVDWFDGPASLLVVRPLPQDIGGGLTRSYELEIARRDSRLQELLGTLELAGIAALTIDEAGRILALNGAGKRIFGYSQNEVAGEGFTTLLAPESHRAAIDLVDIARASDDSGDGREIELFGRPRVGELVPLIARAGRIETALGSCLALTFRDVSGFRRAEAELARARRSAEDLAARQTEFLARVSHEVRTPLNAIIGFAEIMLEERFGPVGSERYRHYLRDIHESGGHVVSLVNDLLDLAKVTSGRSELVFTSLDLGEIVAQSVALMQPTAGRERIVIRTSLAAGLPRLVADERSVRQIALNLVSNAVRFTRPGGQVIVSASLTDQGGLVFRVRDTGIGMSPAEIEEALEPFRQVSAVRREDGTGLGLPLSKALVEANRGVFSMSSRPGEGTLVEVLFPPARVLADE